MIGTERRKIRSRPHFACDTFFPYEDDTMGVVANICLSLGCLDLVEKATPAVDEHIPREAVSDLMTQFIATALPGCAADRSHHVFFFKCI